MAKEELVVRTAQASQSILQQQQKENKELTAEMARDKREV